MTGMRWLVLALAVGGCSERVAPAPRTRPPVTLPPVDPVLALSIPIEDVVILRADGRIEVGAVPAPIAPEGLVVADLVTHPSWIEDVGEWILAQQLVRDEEEWEEQEEPPPEEPEEDDWEPGGEGSEHPRIPTPEEVARARRRERVREARLPPCPEHDWAPAWGRREERPTPRSRSAGLRARAITDDCVWHDVLVIADTAVPAARLVEVLSALPRSLLAVSVDGGAHARALAITFDYAEANARARPGTPALRLEPGQTVGELVPALIAAVDRDAVVAIGEPVRHVIGPLGDGDTSRESAHVPDLRIDALAVTSDARDLANARRYLTRALHLTRACYERALALQPELQGRLSVELRVAASGVIEDLRTAFEGGALGGCLLPRLEALQFPKPRTGAPMVISATFLFRPYGGPSQL